MQTFLMVATSLVLAGCVNLTDAPRSWGGGSVGHGSDTTTGRINYGVTHLTLNDRVYFVLISEGASGASCGSGPPASGTLRPPDGREVEWSCDTRDGRNGRVIVGTEQFELAKGNVLLVNLGNGRTVVEQIAIEEAQLQGGFVENHLKAAAGTNKQLAAFLKICETPKHTEETLKQPVAKQETPPNHRLLTFRGESRSVYSAAFSADALKVLTCEADDTARLWDSKTGKKLHEFRHAAGKPGPFGDAGLALARLSPDGRRVLTVTANNYNHGPEAWPGCQSASAGEEQRVNDSVRLWDVDTQKVIAEWTTDYPEKLVHGVSPFGAAFSPDSRLVATTFGSDIDRSVHVRDTATGKERFRLTGHVHPVVDVVFSADSKLIATASLDQTARIWDAATGKCIQTLQGHKSGVTGVTFSPDGLRLLTLCAGYTHRFKMTPNSTSGGGSSASDVIARVWDVKTGEQLKELTWGRPAGQGITLGPLKIQLNVGIGETIGYVRTACYSPDGKSILTAGVVGSSSGGDERHPTIWTIADGKRGVAFKGEAFRDVLASAFSPDGKRVATAGKDGIIRVWDATTGKELLKIRGHAKLVRTVAFNSKGDRLLTASDDGTAGVWDVSKP